MMALPPPTAARRQSQHVTAIVPSRPSAALVYRLIRAFFQVSFFTSIRSKTRGLDHLPQSGAFILACSHLSHTEPLCISVIVNRKIDWMARIEFFRWAPFARFLRAIDAFSVHRQGVPVRAIRTAIHRLRQGRIIGIFPEGGVTAGPDSVCRGGPIKHGAILIAAAAGVPIVPCVMLGTHKLNHVLPWIPPLKLGRLWTAFGEPVQVPPMPSGPSGGPQRRALRQAVANQLMQQYVHLYQQLLQNYDIRDSSIP